MRDDHADIALIDAMPTTDGLTIDDRRRSCHATSSRATIMTFLVIARHASDDSHSAHAELPRRKFFLADYYVDGVDIERRDATPPKCLFRDMGDIFRHSPLQRYAALADCRRHDEAPLVKTSKVATAAISILCALYIR